jgi:hypothetical protein
MTTTALPPSTSSGARTPIDRLLTASLVIGPLVYLAADSTYAVRGWDDPTAGVLHVIGAILCGLVVLRAAAWTPPDSVLRLALVVTGVIGAVGNGAYGFDAIHQSYGDRPLVDRSGAAILIKPLGLFVPISLALVALALRHIGRRASAVIVLLSAMAWPVAHIGNFGPLAVVVNVGLVVGLGSAAWARPEA